MNTLLGNRDRLGLAVSTKVAFLLIVSLLLWSLGVPALLQQAHAANLTFVSDTLSSSNLSTVTKHVIRFTNPTAINPGDSIKIQLDPNGSAFSEAFSAATTSDIFLSGFTIVTSCTTGQQATVAASYNGGTDENLTFTICGTASAITGGTANIITVGSTTPLWTNPAGAGSYRITIGGSMTDSGETRVAVLQNVTVTASVNTSFTFTVSGVASSTSIGVGGGGDQTSTTSTATAMKFGTLASGTPYINAQQLQVSTNARNGFSVTVQENQPPTSATGATIDLFKNGATTTTPVPWTSPTAILDVPSSYGHFGVTSNDSDEGTGEFTATTTTPYVGNFDQPRVVFSHTGPSDGSTQDKGKAIVGFKMQVSDLQEAGNDYTDTITYVATPTF